MSIASNIEQVKRRIVQACERSGRSPEEVKIIAVSKGFGVREIEEAVLCGLRDFGESHIQEAREKIPFLAHLPINWHLVGHLQTNKAGWALKLFRFIHSLDSLRLAQRLNRLANCRVPVLLQVNISGEVSKFGLPVEEVKVMVREVSQLPNLELRGLMTIAPLANNPEEVRPVFRYLRKLRDALGLRELSMGMSDDFEIAVEEGATMLRIGRAIFGKRGK